MGCGLSKPDHSPLLIRCRERKNLIKAAANHRYSLASAHLAYFRSLNSIGDSLLRFVHEDPNPQNSSSSTSLSHSLSNSHIQLSDSDSESGHIHIQQTPDSDFRQGPSYSTTTNMYYMKRSSEPIQSVIYDPSSLYENVGLFDFQIQNQELSPPPVGPPPPPSPKVSTWDFLNPFDVYDYNSNSKYGFGSVVSSPDSIEVREREGIPDLEDEEVEMGKKENSGEGNSRAVPLDSWKEPSSQHNEVKNESSSSSSDIIVLKSKEDDGSARNNKQGMSFEVDSAGSPHDDAESEKISSFNSLSAHGTRDLKEVVAEIRDEFALGSSYSKEVAMLLEVGKVPYQPRFTFFKVRLSRILWKRAPTASSSNKPSRQSVRLAFDTKKLAKLYYGDLANNGDMKSSNLSSILERLYAWEKKLYKEVKYEEKLRAIYEKKCKRLKVLDEQGAESSKINATQASIRKLLTKLNVCIKAVDAISSRIDKLRDEELQPQVNELIYGLIRMWRAMLKCHKKQFQAIMQSKTRSLRANTVFRRDSSLRATVELEMELLTWCSCFNDWIHTQKSFIESLNGWLLRCVFHVPEETPDGIAPFSPGRIGAPSIFVICNDWSQAMQIISEKGVSKAMHSFASSLQELWEKQDEQSQRLKAENLSKDIERWLKTLRMKRKRLERDRDTRSDKTGVSIVPSESGVSPLDDLKVDLDSIREKLQDERARHKEAAILVHNVTSNSLQAGLVPIFEALGNFTSETLKAYEHVRIQNAVQHTEGK